MPITFVDENKIEVLLDMGNNNFVEVVPCSPGTSGANKDGPHQSATVGNVSGRRKKNGWNLFVSDNMVGSICISLRLLRGIYLVLKISASKM